MNALPARGLRPGPAQPTVFRRNWQKPLAFEDLPALARHIHRARGGRAMQLVETTASWHGSDTFPAIEVHWLVDSDTDYAFTIVAPGRPREAVEAAIARANPVTA